MATDNVDYGVQKGSGRFRLPSRLAKTIYTANGPQLKSFTTTERNALAPGASGKGLIVFDDTLDQVVLWDGAAWVNPDGTALA